MKSRLGVFSVLPPWHTGLYMLTPHSSLPLPPSPCGLLDLTGSVPGHTVLSVWCFGKDMRTQALQCTAGGGMNWYVVLDGSLVFRH